jgi:short-chain 2-methylacyl-CoA dehydrogenase
MENIENAVTTPLTSLRAEESRFRESSRRFDDETVRPFVKGVDEQGCLNRNSFVSSLIWALWGVEVPAANGGECERFFAILAVEKLSRVDPSAGAIVDVQNMLVNNALLR